MSKADNLNSTAPTASRRNMLAATLAALGAAVAAPSIVTAATMPSGSAAALMRRLADLTRKQEADDAAHAPSNVLGDNTTRMIELEQAIIASIPATVEDAAAILFVAACEVDLGVCCADSPARDETLAGAQNAIRRVAMFLGRRAGMDLHADVGEWYLCAHMQAGDPARVA